MPDQISMNSSIIYTADGDDIEVMLESENVWATQKSISDIFDTDTAEITKHLGNIFSEGELDEGSNVKEMVIAQSTCPVKLFSLDAIISAGYRVNSKKATQFRVWATAVLKQYIKDGFVINEELLRSDPDQSPQNRQ